MPPRLWKQFLQKTAFALTACLILTSPAHATTTPLDDINLPEVKAAPWNFKEFPITAWWGPPGTAKPDDFVAYKDAGFNLYQINPDTGAAKAWEYATSAGLKLMVFSSKQIFDLPASDFKLPEDLSPVAMWLTHDEPSGYAGVAAAIAAVNTLMQKDPTRWAMFNLLPPEAQKDPATTEVIKAAVAHGMPIISYDNYVLHNNGDQNPLNHFRNLDLFRQESLKYDKPFWAFALTVKHFDYRRSSESDLRWKQFTNLAYGAKGLWYFTYWGPTDWEGWDKIAIVDPKDGSKTELYPYVKAINATVQKMGRVLLGLTNQDTVHTSAPEGQRAFTKDKFWIKDIQAENALIGFFKDKAGAEYALVVNKKHGKDLSAAATADTMTLTFAPHAKVEAVSWMDGKEGPLPLDSGKAELKISGGTGVLLKLLK